MLSPTPTKSIRARGGKEKKGNKRKKMGGKGRWEEKEDGRKRKMGGKGRWEEKEDERKRKMRGKEDDSIFET